MIRHTIIFKVKPYLSAEVISQAMIDIYESLVQLPGVLTVVTGECDFHDDKSTQFFEQGASHAISIDFKTPTDLERFFDDRALDAIKQGIVDITDGGYHSIAGMSMQMISD